MQSATLRIAPRVSIPLREIELTFVCSGGPGGQNVNKVASKVLARFNLLQSPSIPPALRTRAYAHLRARLTRDGTLLLSCDTYKSQSRNRTAVLQRLCSVLAKAMQPPKQRRATQPTRAARERRLQAKTRLSRLKGERTWRPAKEPE